jgi:excinuclease UvrABC nuclease subunit
MYLWSENVNEEVKAKFARNVKCPVVYMFLDKKDNVLYVGKSTYFATRWSQHVRSEKPITKVNKVILFTYKSVAEAEFVESQFIVANQPAWNKQGLDETLSDYRIPWVDRVELKVLTKHLNAFLQKEYALE